MQEQPKPPKEDEYPLGRGYGHDYMRGGEVFGGYGYASRDEYEKPRGEVVIDLPSEAPSNSPPS